MESAPLHPNLSTAIVTFTFGPNYFWGRCTDTFIFFVKIDNYHVLEYL